MKLQQNKVLFKVFIGRGERTLVVASSETIKLKNNSLSMAEIDLKDQDLSVINEADHWKVVLKSTAADGLYSTEIGKNSGSPKASTKFGFHLGERNLSLKNDPTCSRTHVKSMLHRKVA